MADTKSNVVEATKVDAVVPEPIVATTQGGKDAGVIAVGGPTAVATPERKSHICCGCCCDVRRATIIVDIIFVCFSVIDFALSWAGVGIANSMVVEDDEVQNALDVASPYFLSLAIVSSLNIVFAIIGIIGGAKFNKFLVLATGVWLCILAVLQIALFRNYLGFIVPGLFAYPHIALYMELNKGIITPETYEIEKHSCCCV